MSVDKSTVAQLTRYAQVFKDARERGANESDTVMYLVKMFGDVLGYDSLAGEISKEVAIKDRYCDFCVKLDGAIEYIVEVKSAAHKALKEKDIEQAENYASRGGISWVLLTNGIEWRLYHLVFAEGEGITHDLVFAFDLLEEVGANAEKVWSLLGMISKEGILNDEHETYLSQKKVLSPASLIKVLVSDPVLTVIRRELNRDCEFRLDVEDVFSAIKDIISKDSLMEAGDLCYKKRRKRRKQAKADKPNLDDGSSVSRQPESTSSAGVPSVPPVASVASPPGVSSEQQNNG